MQSPAIRLALHDAPAISPVNTALNLSKLGRGPFGRIPERRPYTVNK
jgi:hypothetical protein